MEKGEEIKTLKIAQNMDFIANEHKSLNSGQLPKNIVFLSTELKSNDYKVTHIKSFASPKGHHNLLWMQSSYIKLFASL